ncbi:MAG TPA: hypothetical protein DD730_08120 [Desulfosporosinus sp.]|nr:hypothetical protein [Desulfosporosinus sp.]
MKSAFTVWCLLPIIISVFYIVYYFRSKEINDMIAGLLGIVGYIFYQVIIAIASPEIVTVYILQFFTPCFVMLLIVGVKEGKRDVIKGAVGLFLFLFVMVLLNYFLTL